MGNRSGADAGGKAKGFDYVKTNEMASFIIGWKHNFLKQIPNQNPKLKTRPLN